MQSSAFVAATATPTATDPAPLVVSPGFLMEAFGSVVDPRRRQGTRYSLAAILALAVVHYPTVTVVRAQRAVLQQWKVDVPWASAGEITIANGGDVAKDAGLVPA